MKLRNKYTGDIRDFESLNLIVKAEDPEDGFESWNDYHSLAEVNEEWEDYKPAERLIKDEKIRKAVRAWAESNGLENEAFYICTPFYRMLRILARGRRIEFPNDGSFGEIDFTKGYTIIELCGEEE